MIFFMDPFRIQYIHIPKCAGNSVFFALRSAMKTQNTEMLNVFASIEAARQVKWGLPWTAWEEHYLECRQYLLQCALHRGVELIGGHYPFSPVAHFWFHEKYRFCTVLREPVERFISNIIWLTLADGRHPLEEFENGNVEIEPEFDFLMQHEMTPCIAKTYCIYLGGLDAKGRGDLAGSKERALEHLHKIDLIGIQEDMDRFQNQFRERYGKPLILGKRNETVALLKNSLLRERVQKYFDEPRRKLIAEWCREDNEVYEKARRLSMA